MASGESVSGDHTSVLPFIYKQSHTECQRLHWLYYRRTILGSAFATHKNTPTQRNGDHSSWNISSRGAGYPYFLLTPHSAHRTAGWIVKWTPAHAGMRLHDCLSEVI